MARSGETAAGTRRLAPETLDRRARIGDTGCVRHRDRRQRKPLRCAQCEYDLRGKEHDDRARCPECGTSVAESMRLHELHQRQNARVIKAVIIAVLIAVTVGIIWIAFSVDETCGRVSLLLIVAWPLNYLRLRYATPMNYRRPYQ